MKISSVNFIHLLDLTRRNLALWQESNLRPCDSGAVLYRDGFTGGGGGGGGGGGAGGVVLFFMIKQKNY
jgi:hypothetical protein